MNLEVVVHGALKDPWCSGAGNGAPDPPHTTYNMSVKLQVILKCMLYPHPRNGV